MNFRSNILKIAIFATGLSGIVAEYILSTLATYFLGNSVFQWTMIVSIMMFSMGLGSRISKSFHKNLLETFISVEFVLSICVAFSSLIAYTAASFTIYNGFIIYGMSILVGLLIGMEIPLVIRLNEQFQSLRFNVSSVMENDYYGSLVGGWFYAFIGLPILGLTYTPFLLGAVNLIVALSLLYMVQEKLNSKYRLRFKIAAVAVVLAIVSGVFIAKPVIIFGEQKKYKDQVIYSEQSKYQRIVMTQWKNDFWLFLDGHQQLSSLDEVMYHEPLVHPAMRLHPHPQRVLILGGGDGCATREVLKYPSVEKIILVDLDKQVTELGKNHPRLVELNENALSNPKVEVLNTDGYAYLLETKEYFDVIILDFPDPRSVELSRLYSYEFYRLCYQQLRPHGTIVTQAGSPYYATKAFQCIQATMNEAGFSTLPLHNQVISLGEWGWVLGTKQKTAELKQKVQALNLGEIETKWLNSDGLKLISSFGKDIFSKDTNRVKINRIHDPALFRYYQKGNWDMY